MKQNKHLAESDRRYVKFKAKQVKKARNKGMTGKANRHVRELFQYLGVEDGGELPIESVIESEDNPVMSEESSSRLQQLRQGETNE